MICQNAEQALISNSVVLAHPDALMGISIKKKYTLFHTEQIKMVLLPFVQDYTSYQNHILLCKRSPKKKYTQ